MNAEEYIKERLEPEIDWYDSKSKGNKRGYYLLRIIEIFCAIAIPFLTGYLTDSSLNLRTVVGILGVVIALIAGLLGLFQLQENWISYRTTCETLRHEKYLFLTRSKPYDANEADPLFVERCEMLISKENTDWSQMLKTQKKAPRE
jgi:Protein of unknown function (DUF4231)